VFKKRKRNKRGGSSQDSNRQKEEDRDSKTADNCDNQRSSKRTSIIYGYEEGLRQDWASLEKKPLRHSQNKSKEGEGFIARPV